MHSKILSLVFVIDLIINTEKNWESSWFSFRRGYWTNKDNRRALFQRVSKEYDIQYPAEWSRIGFLQIKKIIHKKRKARN